MVTGADRVTYSGKLGRVFLLLVLVASVALSSIPARAQPEAPLTNAENIIILSDFNEVLYERNAYQRIPLASLTKLMTAIVVMRHSNIDYWTTIVEDDLVGEATMGLVAGDELSLGDLLYGLLIPSGNDAAMAIARTVGWQPGDVTSSQSVNRFVALMNQTARDMGLRDTHFMNPHGLDEPYHFSTAHDVAIMLRAALNYPELRQRMTTPAIRVGPYYDLYANNQLLHTRNDYLGGKTGLTDGAGFCLAAAVRSDGRMVIAVAMRDDWNWWDDVDALLDYGLELAHERGVPSYAPPEMIGSQLDQPRNMPLLAREEPADDSFIGPLLPGHGGR